MNDDDQSGETSADYNRRIGARLRSIRRQRKLTLVEVEVDSRAEFKPSVLGAYERGERAISVLRLARLARLYSVPIEQLLPHEHSTADRVLNGDSAPIAVDLVKLAGLTIGPFDKLQRFFRLLEIERHDFNGKVITVRAADRRTLALILEVSIDEVRSAMDRCDLLYAAPDAAG